MTQMLFSLLAIILYSVSGYFLARRLFHNREKPRETEGLKKSLIITIGLIAVALHAITLYSSLFSAAGLNIGFFNALSLITWLIALLILTAAFSNPVESLGVFLLPLASLAILLEMLIPTQHTLIAAQALELKLHIIMSMLSYSLLSIAAVQSILLAIQDKHLRNKRPGGFIRSLPPLQTMETLLFQLIGLGLAILTLALISGTIYLDDMFAQHVAHKTILSIVAWVVFATLLWGRWRFGWRGRIAIRWTLSGFVVLFLAYMGSKLVMEIMLGR